MSRDPRRDDLHRLLEKRIEDLIEEESAAFDQVTAGGPEDLVLFGAGHLGRKTLEGLRKAGVEPIAFCDNNPALLGGDVQGLQVLSPQEAARRYGQKAVFVATIWGGELTDRMSQRLGQLKALGCKWITHFGPLFWKYSDIFLPHYAVDLPHHVLERAGEVMRAYDLLADDKSRQEFAGHVRWRVAMDFDGLGDPIQDTIYLPDDLVRWLPDEVYVDCGAYTGDTLKTFLDHHGWSFSHAFALEPDPGTFARLMTSIDECPEPVRGKITAMCVAAGARAEKIRFDATGTAASACGAGDAEADCAPLDGLLSDAPISFLKMDIEGAELDALTGARGLIQRHRPFLAICAYHRQDHLWKIPLAIHSMVADYSYFFRPYLAEGWDLVCYGVPSERLSTSHEV